jgi:hypothetical protein
MVLILIMLFFLNIAAGRDQGHEHEQEFLAGFAVID